MQIIAAFKSPEIESIEPGHKRAPEHETMIAGSARGAGPAEIRASAKTLLGRPTAAENGRMGIQLLFIAIVGLVAMPEALVVWREAALYVIYAAAAAYIVGAAAHVVIAARIRLAENGVQAGDYLAQELVGEADAYIPDRTAIVYSELKNRYIRRAHVLYALCLISDREGYFAFCCHKIRHEWNLAGFAAANPAILDRKATPRPAAADLAPLGERPMAAYRQTVRGWDYWGESSNNNIGRNVAQYRGILVWSDYDAIASNNLALSYVVVNDGFQSQPLYECGR